MGFCSYSLECLGGRTQWVPFHDLIANISQNQLYILRDGDLKKFDPDKPFDAKGFKISMDDKNQRLLCLNYENISADLGCQKLYLATFQFAPHSMAMLTQIIINSPEIVIPSEFGFSKNIPIENWMKSMMCKARIILGPTSLG